MGHQGARPWPSTGSRRRACHGLSDSSMEMDLAIETGTGHLSCACLEVSSHRHAPEVPGMDLGLIPEIRGGSDRAAALFNLDGWQPTTSGIIIATDPTAHPATVAFPLLSPRPVPRLLDRSLRGPAAALTAQMQGIGRVVLNNLTWASPSSLGLDESGVSIHWEDSFRTPVGSQGWNESEMQPHLAGTAQHSMKKADQQPEEPYESTCGWRAAAAVIYSASRRRNHRR
jgi:hypothetical protein